MPVFGSFGADSAHGSNSFELGGDSEVSYDDSSSLNANAAPFEPPAIFGVASDFSGASDTGNSSVNSSSSNTTLPSSSTDSSSRFALNAVPAEGGC